MKKYFKLVLTFALVVICSLLVVSCGSKGDSRALWDKYVNAVNNRDALAMAKTYYTNDIEAENYVAENGEAMLEGILSLTTVEFKDVVSCDLSNNLKTAAYYGSLIKAKVGTLEGTQNVEFMVYSYKDANGTFFTELPNFNIGEASYGNTPNELWYQNAYFTTKEYIYQLSKDGSTATISKQQKNVKELVIPSEIDGVPVTTIGKYAFYRFNRVFSFTVSSSKLQSVTFPETLVTIQKSAFYQCTKLKEITIPESVKTIESSAFASCTSLEKIVINANDDAIYEGLEPQEVAGDVITLKGGYKAVNAGDIINIYAESDKISVANVGWTVSGGGASIEVQVDNSIKLTCATAGTVTITAYDLNNRTAVTTMKITVKTTNPVKSIDYTAFDRCSNLKELYITASNPNSIKIMNFTKFSLSKEAKIYVPKGSKAKYIANAAWADYADQFVEME